MTDNDLGTLHRLEFSISPPEKHGRMWWSKDWLFVVMTNDRDVNLEAFLNEYLMEIQPGTAASEPTDAPAAEEPAAEESAADESVTDEPATEGPTDEPATDEPASAVPQF